MGADLANYQNASIDRVAHTRCLDSKRARRLCRRKRKYHSWHRAAGHLISLSFDGSKDRISPQIQQPAFNPPEFWRLLQRRNIKVSAQGEQKIDSFQRDAECAQKKTAGETPAVVISLLSDGVFWQTAISVFFAAFALAYA